MKLCQLIIKNVKETNPEDEKGVTPLQLATKKGHSSVIELLSKEIGKKRKPDSNQTSSKVKRSKKK